MANFFDNVKPGSRVHYLTPQGQTHSGTVVINKGTHLVLNRGGGQPQVVTPKNYVKHSEGGKVKGALLSNLAKSMKKEEVINELSPETKASYKEAKEPRAFRNIEDETPILPHVIGMHVLRNKPEHKYDEKKVTQYAKHVNSKFKKDDSFRKKVLSNANGGNAGRDFLYKYAHKFYDDMLPKTNEESHNLPRTGTDDVVDYANPPVKTTYDLDPKVKAKLTAKLIHNGRWRKPGADKPQDPLLLRQHSQRLGVSAKKSMKKYPLTKEEKDPPFDPDPPKKNKGIVVGKRAPEMSRVRHLARMAIQQKKFKDAAVTGNPRDFANEAKQLKDHNWSDSSQFSVQVGKGYPKVRDYVDRLKAHGVPHRKIHSPYQGHVAFNVPYDYHRKASKILFGEDAQLDATKSALAYTTKMQKKKKKHALKTMKEDLINELSSGTLSRYVTKAIADRKATASTELGRLRTHLNKHYVNDGGANVRISKRSEGIKKAVAKIASNLPAEPLAAHAAGEKSKHGGWSGMEARESEYRANQHLGGGTPRRSPGHYLVRDGRTLSGPHKPDEAVSKYREMSDNKSVKIVHVKEAVENKAKAEKAVKFALNKAKKLKGKTANVEPEMETPSASMSQPMLQGQEGPGNVRI